MEEHQIALNKAKIELMSTPDSAFFIHICFSLKHEWDNSIPTAATNGLYIKFNPDFFMKQTPAQRVGLLLHETMHVAYLHPLRRGTRDPRKFNVAGDHVINIGLLERGFKLPNDGLHDFQYKGMSTEQVYDLLPDPPVSYIPDVIEGDGEGEEISNEVKQHIEDIVIQAAIQSKLQGDKPGTIPGDIQIFLDGLLKPKLPWNRILQKYINNMTKRDYTFKKPNRRFFPQYHLPSLYSESLMDIAIAVDASGSVSDDDFKVFISETHSILRMMKPEKISLIQFDTVIKSVETIKNIKELHKVKFFGRGGTRIGPVLDWAREYKPKLLLVFTDGDFNFYHGDVASTETIWLIHNNEKFKAATGKVIHYNV